jgi:hypothetical protein
MNGALIYSDTNEVIQRRVPVHRQVSGEWQALVLQRLIVSPFTILTPMPVIKHFKPTTHLTLPVPSSRSIVTPPKQKN